MQVERFLELKEQRNAVVLAHFYQDGEIQDLADYLGDSLYLAQTAKDVDADVILFCGVHFMAETAKILNPEKTVIIPDLNAGCSLADSAPADKFAEWIASNPNHTVISYINCSSHIKAMSDIICTSSNAERIVNSVPRDREILFAPDKYLGAYLNKKTGRNMKLWNGSCEVHENFSEIELVRTIHDHSMALVLAHPECPENLLHYADFVGSTNGILHFAQKCDSKEFIILTEPGIIHTMKKVLPEKSFFAVANLDGCSCNNCPYMKLNTLDKMINALETLQPEIIMPEELRLRALQPLERMLETS